MSHENKTPIQMHNFLKEICVHDLIQTGLEKIMQTLMSNVLDSSDATLGKLHLEQSKGMYYIY